MDTIGQLLEKARERYWKTGKYTNFLTNRSCDHEKSYACDDRYHICCMENDSVSLRKFNRLVEEIDRRIFEKSGKSFHNEFNKYDNGHRKN